MIRSIARRSSIYGAMAAVVPKMFLAYRAWFWSGILLNTIAMAIFVFFWRAVYAGTDTIAGMTMQQTLTYVLLARIFGVLSDFFVLWDFGWSVREGNMAIFLLRPVDLQGSYYVQALANTLTFLAWQAPQAVIATVLFGLQWPADPGVWAAFVLAAFLGRTVIYFFDYLLSCLVFYTTEVWGLSVLLEGVNMFFSGALVPLVMMPGWLQAVAQAFPFAQAIYAPLSILTGIVPLENAWQVWLTQLIWIAVLLVLSRLLFRVAVRKITVQGG